MKQFKSGDRVIIEASDGSETKGRVIYHAAGARWVKVKETGRSFSDAYRADTLRLDPAPDTFEVGEKVGYKVFGIQYEGEVVGVERAYTIRYNRPDRSDSHTVEELVPAEALTKDADVPKKYEMDLETLRALQSAVSNSDSTEWRKALNKILPIK